MMDMDTKDANGSIMDKLVVASSLDGEKVEDHANGEDDSDSNSLLPPQRGGMSRNSDKACRKVQWNDKNGNKLAEVLEYEPRVHFDRYPIGLEGNSVMSVTQMMRIQILVSAQ